MKKYALLTAVAIVATGCATMINGKDQTLSVDSFPTGASIILDCGDVPREGGNTPAKMKVQRAADRCLIFLSRDGYETKEVVLQHRTSRATALNGVFGLPAAVVFGVAGVIIGSTIGLEDMGAEIGAEAGMNLGAGVAANVDKSGGGWEWVPGRIFVTLVRTEIAAEVAAERREPHR
jgi:hypothetical protein